MTQTKTLSHNDTDGITALLTGRRITAVEQGHFDRPGEQSWGDSITGRLTLDDGTIVYVAPNEGGCACSAGDYYLKHLATVDNIITSVRLAVEPDPAQAESWEPDQSYRIYVVADATEINAVQIDGNDGNGYYGTGYELIVVIP